MSETIRVKATLRDYEADFVEGFESTLSMEIFKESFFVVDGGIMKLYGERLAHLIPAERLLVVEAAEANKTLGFCEKTIRELIKRNIKKNNARVAIGGGIIQDITAFISCILFRGIEWFFFPTTLLGQGDSCIGSKSSINVGDYKNQLGTFYPPSRIFIDTAFLKTLPVGEIKSGIGEMLHFYFIAGSEEAENICNDYEQLFEDRSLLKRYIRASLEIKKKVIEIDEYDRNERNLFNYGHTFGHAIEAVSAYGVPHGQAVTMGMDIANFVSLKLGSLDGKNFDRMHRVLVKNMPAFQLKEDRIDDYFKALSKDKKNIGGRLGCILTSGPGKMRKEQLDLDDGLKGMILSYFESVPGSVC